MKTLNFKHTGLLTVALSAALAGAASAQDAPRLVINGEPFETRVEPITQDGRVLVPLRDIFENLGAHVNYDDVTQTITAHREGTDVEMRLGSPRARVDGRPVRLDVPANSIDGRTMVPLRFVSEALGATVNYSQSRNVVHIDDNRGHRGDRDHRYPDTRNGDHRDGDRRDGDHRDGDPMNHDRMGGNR